MTMPSNRLTILLYWLAVIGCTASDEDIANGDDPIEALAVPQRSERYTTAYWTYTKRDDPELWAEAVEYCQDKRADYPNCETVRQVQIIDPGRLPEDSPDTFNLRMSAPPDQDTTPR